MEQIHFGGDGFESAVDFGERTAGHCDFHGGGAWFFCDPFGEDSGCPHDLGGQHRKCREDFDVGQQHRQARGFVAHTVAAFGQTGGAAFLRIGFMIFVSYSPVEEFA